MATTYLTRTPATATNRKTWTYSVWVKRSSLTSASNGQTLFDTEGGDINTNFIFQIDGGGGTAGDTDSIGLHNYGNDVFTTPQLLRDVSGWYHIVLALDTTQAATADRIKLWVNGVSITLTQGANWPAQDQLMGINNNVAHYIGSHGTNANYYFEGLMSSINFADGTAYTASTFGSEDATTGEWKINVNPTFTLGTNGFSILKNGNTITDQSTNSNNWTLGAGTLTNTEDCPSSIYATFNSTLYDASGDIRYANGNTTVFNADTVWESSFGTLGFTKGKFYWELKVEALNASNGYANAGIQCLDNAFGSGIGTTGNTTTYFTANTASAGLEMDYRGGSNNNTFSGGSNIGDTGIDYSNGDILGFAADMDNKALYIHKNGTYITVGGDVGDPTSGASKTGAIDIPTSVTTCSPAVSIYGANAIFNYNFGNGVFKTTAVSSAGTNASGIGVFEYDVPTNYTALSTKGLNV